MEINDIVNIVTSVGFPIVASGAMGWYVKYISDKHSEEVQQLNSIRKKWDR